MASALVYRVTYWIKPTMNHDISYSIVMIHQASILYEFSTLREF